MNLISKRIISNQNAMAEVVSTLSKDMVSERARKPHKLSVNMCDSISICESVSEPKIKATIGQEIQLFHCNLPWDPFKTATVHYDQTNDSYIMIKPYHIRQDSNHHYTLKCVNFVPNSGNVVSISLET
eukprot:959512_1